MCLSFVRFDNCFYRFLLGLKVYCARVSLAMCNRRVMGFSWSLRFHTECRILQLCSRTSLPSPSLAPPSVLGFSPTFRRRFGGRYGGQEEKREGNFCCPSRSPYLSGTTSLDITHLDGKTYNEFCSQGVRFGKKNSVLNGESHIVFFIVSVMM